MLNQRLQSHLFAQHMYTTPKEIIEHYGCMQAQDTRRAKWCIASRLTGICEEDIDLALVNKDIVRTRPMRGTLHYMDPQQVHWMLDMCASKTLKGFEKRRAFLGIRDVYAEKALQLIDIALRGGKVLTRGELGSILQAGGIPMETQWVYHLTCYAATKKLICFGPPQGKEDTFVLLDEWLPCPTILTKEEQLATLARMYVRSHGPVTVDDLVWRTGLGKTVCKEAIALIVELCTVQKHQGKTYYSLASSPRSSHQGFHFLGGFDEYFIAYKDRSLLADIAQQGKLYTKNGIFFPLILLDGEIIGTWKRTFQTSTIDIVCTMIDTKKSYNPRALKDALVRYTTFSHKELGKLIFS